MIATVVTVSAVAVLGRSKIGYCWQWALAVVVNEDGALARRRMII